MPILVADASMLEIHKRNIDLLKKYNVKYIYLPDEFFMEAISRSLMLVNSNFVAFCQDDDFIFPDFIASAVDFLTDNPDYIICNGRYAIGGEGSYLLQSNKEAEHEDPLERLTDYMGSMSPTLFTV